jgi:hypothetical protein
MRFAWFALTASVLNRRKPRNSELRRRTPLIEPLNYSGTGTSHIQIWNSYIKILDDRIVCVGKSLDTLGRRVSISKAMIASGRADGRTAQIDVLTSLLLDVPSESYGLDTLDRRGGANPGSHDSIWKSRWLTAQIDALMSLLLDVPSESYGLDTLDRRGGANPGSHDSVWKSRWSNRAD